MQLLLTGSQLQTTSINKTHRVAPRLTTPASCQDRYAATERLIKHLGLYERDNEQSKAQSLIDVLNAISSGKNALDLARERDEARQRSRH